MGEKWKSLSEEQKQPYNDKAAADKERFQKEMDAWSAPCPTQPELMLATVVATCIRLAHISGIAFANKGIRELIQACTGRKSPEAAAARAQAAAAEKAAKAAEKAAAKAAKAPPQPPPDAPKAEVTYQVAVKDEKAAAPPPPPPS